MRWILLTFLLSSCGHVRDCAPGTLLLWLSLPPLADDAYVLGVDVTIGTLTRENRFEIPRPVPEQVSVEIDFPSGYPTGQDVAVTASLFRGSDKLAAAGNKIRMNPECGVMGLELK